MFTIRLAQLLAGEENIDARTANRLGTMHYFLNRYHPEQYEQFLENLERFDSASKLEAALEDYLMTNEHHERTQPIKIRVTKRNDSAQERRSNDIQGNYGIDLVYDNNQTLPLHLDRWVSHVLYIIILGFTRNGMPWKLKYLTDDQYRFSYIEDLISLIYEDKHDAHDFTQTLKADNYSTIIRNTVKNKLKNSNKENLLYWFAPNNVGSDQFVFPLPPNAIKMPQAINSIIKEWCREIRRKQIRVGQRYDIEDFEPTNHFVDEVVASLSDTSSYFGINQTRPTQATEDCRVSLGNCARWIQYHRNMDDPTALAALAEIYEHNPIERERPRNGRPSFDEPDVLSRNYAREAFDIWERLAKQGNAQGQYRYATHYILGKLVDQDFEEAVHWLQQAADQGHQDATWILGKCYFYGHGVLEDKEKAFKRYKQAADLGSTGAARDAANCLMEGIGTVRDVSQAYEYLKIAAQKDTMALDFCMRLMGDDYQVSLPEERIEDMEKMYNSDEWKELRFHFKPDTQAGEPRLKRLVHSFSKLGPFSPKRALDLLDKFKNIPSEMHWIEHVNRALYRQLNADKRHILEIVPSDSEELKYDVRFQLSDGRTVHLSSLFNRPNNMITYMIIAAFSSRLEDGFTTSYAEDNGIYADACRELWMEIDNNASRYNVQRLVNEYILNLETDYNQYAGNLKAVNKLLSEKIGKESSYFAVPDIQGKGKRHYRRIPKGTEIILPQEIEAILNQHHVGNSGQVVE